jgi:hypothetical protein
MKVRQNKKDSSEFDINLLALSGEIGIKLSLPLLILMLFGIWIDKRLNTLPLFTLAGAGLALATSSYMIYKMITQINRK